MFTSAVRCLVLAGGVAGLSQFTMPQQANAGQSIVSQVLRAYGRSALRGSEWNSSRSRGAGYSERYSRRAYRPDFDEYRDYRDEDNRGSDEQFLWDLYDEYLGRAPDDQGYEYWMEKLERGVPRHEVRYYLRTSRERRQGPSDGQRSGRYYRDDSRDDFDDDDRRR